MTRQNYHLCQAVERAVQTFSGLENCNVLGMNMLKVGLVQAFTERSPRDLAILLPISSYPKDVAKAFWYSKHPQYRWSDVLRRNDK